LHRLPDIAHQIIASDSMQCLCLSNSFPETSENIAINHMLLKTGFFGLHFYHRQ